MKTENILAVTKLGVDYGWFTLVTTNGTELTVYNHGLKWEVDNTQKEAEIMVLKTDKSGQVVESIIRGTKKSIENFMYSVGYGTANKKSDGVYQHTFAELQSQTQNLIWELEELKEKIEPQHIAEAIQYNCVDDTVCIAEDKSISFGYGITITKSEIDRKDVNNAINYLKSLLLK